VYVGGGTLVSFFDVSDVTPARHTHTHHAASTDVRNERLQRLPKKNP